MAKQFGKTWWGQEWLLALNNIDYSNRLPRGSSYARKGAVKHMEIHGNRIFAEVEGSNPFPYEIEIVIPTFCDRKTEVFLEVIESHPMIISRLLNRELDPLLVRLAEKAGLRIFPRQWTDLTMHCSCPDRAVPCKHLAAVIYKLSEEIDNNPFLVFELHLLDLIAELNKRGSFISRKAVEIPQLADFYIEDKKKTTAPEKNVPGSQNIYRQLIFTSLSPIHEPLLSLLPEKPVFFSSTTDFKSKYGAALQKIVKNAQKILQGKTSFAYTAGFPENEDVNIRNHDSCFIVTDENFRTSAMIGESRVSVREMMMELSRIPSGRIQDYQLSAVSLHTAFLLALHLTANGAIIPQVVMMPDRQYAIRWIPAAVSKEVRTLENEMAEIIVPGIFRWQEAGSEKKMKDQAQNLLSVFITELITMLSGKAQGEIFHDLFFASHHYAFNAPGERASAGGIQTWLRKYYLTQGGLRPQLVVSEINSNLFLVEINISGIKEFPEEQISLRTIFSLDIFKKYRSDILQTMAAMSDFIPGLEQCINSKGQYLIVMDHVSFTPFLFRMIPIISLLDVEVLLPKSLQDILRPKPSVKVKAKPGRSFLSLEEMLSFDWQVAVGDTVMDEEEFKKILDKSDTLIRYKSQYMYVGKEELEKLHRHFSSGQELSSREILHAALSGEYQGAKIAMDDDVLRLIRELTSVHEVPLPESIRAELRPYQKRGYSWLYRNSKIGIGSLLADDMGLGKTLQVITTLLKYKEEGLLEDKKVLIIAPTGLLTNWQTEIEKFAPSLSVALFHGAGRKIAAGYDVLLTSYGIARTEASRLKKISWQTVVIDEAQNIKNQDTAQAKAVKSIPADYCIAMSGTPVENRLSELWSIMDYCNRGFLGSSKQFKEDFGMPVEVFHDVNAAEKLKKITAPFMMRRLKSDQSIISDLPDKMEIDMFTTLTAEQAALYEKTLEEALMALEAIDPQNSKELFKRQGLVLQMILALKQICNHPAQFLKNNRREASLSGKMALLFDTVDSIVESGEKVLIFTQFKEMGDLILYFLEERYKETLMFYHGGCTLKQRKEMIHRFQHNPADKIFILSLKAAGTGLNLTAASHVIHYDLWWNPAVEAQATDRAYRIGQKNNVMVHRFITRNTFEERINEMIQSKKALADMTIATGESWIGNLNNSEIKELFAIK
ncbi:SNF2-related protein [uncultured Chryseobacterium sp.]|uniref:SNF2-related protein n=1 Tax=uncultured Chryseobacterium sp. TaxID=259322 RepID=UPI0025E59E3F|nr:SNF2-related protein [uncultured Chryseobacterium sp.]